MEFRGLGTFLAIAMISVPIALVAVVYALIRLGIFLWNHLSWV